MIEDGNYKVRVQAALVLGKLGDPRAVPPLIKALGDQNKTVRGIAASALGQLGDASAVEPLRDLLRHESDPFVRGQAEKALAALSGGGGGGQAEREDLRELRRVRRRREIGGSGRVEDPRTRRCRGSWASCRS